MLGSENENYRTDRPPRARKFDCLLLSDNPTILYSKPPSKDIQNVTVRPLFLTFDNTE